MFLGLENIPGSSVVDIVTYGAVVGIFRESRTGCEHFGPRISVTIVTVWLAPLGGSTRFLRAGCDKQNANDCKMRFKLKRHDHVFVLCLAQKPALSHM